MIMVLFGFTLSGWGLGFDCSVLPATLIPGLFSLATLIPTHLEGALARAKLSESETRTV